MANFTFHLPTRIVFGRPAHETIPAELDALGAQRVLVVSDTGLADLGLVEKLATSLEEVSYAVATFTDVSSNPTTDEVDGGLALARSREVDVLVAIGGGSPIDVAKAIAMLLANGGVYADYQWNGKTITERSWPLIAVPTTAGTGSEVTKVAVVSDVDNPFKKGVLSPLMFPHIAVLDPALTRGMPPWLTAATGIDAFVHALEAYVGRRANPHTDRLALDALGTAWRYLPAAVRDGDDMEARERMMLASLWAGMAMDHAGLGLIHALSGPLTTHLHLHHGLANGIILPYVVAYNLLAISEERRQALSTLFGLAPGAGDNALIEALRQFVDGLGLPTALGELDAPLDDVAWRTMADETTRMVLIHNNPRPASATDCLHILEQMR